MVEDGAYVVQWDATRVQELLTGRYREFKATEFGQALSDYQLQQLKAAGRVEHFNKNYVWLYALPEQNRYEPAPRTLEGSPDRVRAYYLNTTLPKSQRENIEALLNAVDLAERFDVSTHAEMVAVMGKDNAPFKHIEDAEQARAELSKKAPEMFRDVVVAFLDVSARNGVYKNIKLQTSELIDLDTIIKSQTDTTATAGKHAVLVGHREIERKPLHNLLNDLAFKVTVAANAHEALHTLEETMPHLLVTELTLPDMHAWEMLVKAREIRGMQRPITIVVADAGSSSDAQSFGRNVAGVDIFLVRPIVVARLRQSIWTMMMQQTTAAGKNPPAT
jgi:CheY-like chemotaxis protein